MLTGAVAALSVSFLHLAVGEARVAENADRRAALRRAADAALLEALARLQSPDWNPAWVRENGRDDRAAGPGGVRDDPAGRIVVSTAYAPPEPAGDEPRELLAAALSLRVTAVARWEATGEGPPAEAAATVRLSPRAPRSGADPDDRVLVPEGWDDADAASWTLLNDHALTLSGTDGAGVSLTLAPQVRVAGDVWSRGQLAFDMAAADAATAAAWVASLGRTAPGSAGLAAGETAAWPAPVGGGVTLHDGADAVTAGLLDPLGVRRADDDAFTVRRTRVEDLPRTGTARYRLYANGPRYEPTVLADGAAVGGTLRPTAANPLGLFVSPGSVTLLDGADVLGTLAADRITVAGDAAVAAVRWTEPDGAEWFPGSAGWPRPPAALAERGMSLGPACEFDGAVICGGALDLWPGGSHGGVPCWGTVKDVERKGGGRLKLKLNLAGGTLKDMAEDGTRTLRLAAGPDGFDPRPDAPGYPIVKEHRGDKLTVTGAAGDPHAVEGAFFRVDAPAGGRAVFRGPVAARTLVMHPPPPWAALTAAEWAEAYEEWYRTGNKEEVDGEEVRVNQKEMTGEFADPETWEDAWDEAHDEDPPAPYADTGLPVAPTAEFVHRPPAAGGARTAFAPPLFRPDPTFAATPRGGLRWDVRTWEGAR